MVRTRPWRQAQTCGLTYCTVARPCALELRAGPRLNSLESMPTNTSGRQSRIRLRSVARSRRSRGRCVMTSVSPMTASSSMRARPRSRRPASSGPATPANSRLRKRAAQGVDERGAERVAGCFARDQCDAQSAAPGLARLAHEAARGLADEVDERSSARAASATRDCSSATASASFRSERYSTR